MLLLFLHKALAKLRIQLGMFTFNFVSIVLLLPFDVNYVLVYEVFLLGLCPCLFEHVMDCLL